MTNPQPASIVCTRKNNPMKTVLTVLLSFGVLLGITSCHKNNEEPCFCYLIYDPVCGDDGIEYSNSCFAECAGVSYTQGVCPLDQEAVIYWLGEPAVDGCGWVVSFDDINYSPDTLAESFKVDSLPVWIDYTLIGQRAPVCWGAIDYIQIDDIKFR